MIPAQQALARLREGNRRFVETGSGPVGCPSAARHGSTLLERRIERDGLLIVGAEYSVETGQVEFLD